MSAFERAVQSQSRPGYSLAPIAISWDAVAFRIAGGRPAVVAIPRVALASFFDDLDAGRLDAAVLAFIASPPTGRILRAPSQITSVTLFDDIDAPSAVAPDERPRREDKRKRARGRRALVGAIAAGVLVVGAIAAFALRGSDDKPTAVGIAPVTSTSTTTTSTTTSTTSTTTTTVIAHRDITSFGSVTATSTFGGNQFPAELGVDGDSTTSWFSAGPKPEPTVFTWTSTEVHRISTVSLLGNAQNSDPAARTGFGFGTTRVVVTRAGAVVFDQSVDGPGGSIASITVNPDVDGDTIAFTFTGHEAPDCGGFSELTMLGN